MLLRPSAGLLAIALAGATALATLAACRGSGISTSANHPPDGGAAAVAAAPAAAPAPPPGATTARPGAKRLPRIDVHTHIGPDGIARAVRLMDEWGIDGMVNLSGMYPGPPRHTLETQLAAAATATGASPSSPTPTSAWCARARRTTARPWPTSSAESKRSGAIGLKIPKGLGLGYPGARRRAPAARRRSRARSAVREGGRAGHAGRDPHRRSQGVLEAGHARERALGRAAGPPRVVVLRRAACRRGSSSTTRSSAAWRATRRRNFIAVHFGNDPEDPDNVARMLDRYPNFYHRHGGARARDRPPRRRAKMRRFFEKYQDRILFGTDTGIGAEPGRHDVRLERRRCRPRAPTRCASSPDLALLRDAGPQFESPTPIQGRWKIDGVGLPEPILRKVYFDNAVALLRWRPAAGRERRWTDDRPVGRRREEVAPHVQLD